ncbi:MAG: hypothetical protein OEV44_09505 [Spirochaetota bacterium]|nr:hypothetical protein [Spirochaetota bacterium]
MEPINYSKNWDTIFNMPVNELDQLDLKTLDEEDLDALSIRLKQLCDDKRVISVYETMLETDKTNPAVEYTNIFENVIIHLMGEKDYARAINFLNSYLIFDENKRNRYRNHFIRRNMGVCLIFSGKVEKGEKIIRELINESPGNFWNYHDLAFEFYFAGNKQNAIYYLQMGADRAKKVNDDFWFNFFTDHLNNIENE